MTLKPQHLGMRVHKNMREALKAVRLDLERHHFSVMTRVVAALRRKRDLLNAGLKKIGG